MENIKNFITGILYPSYCCVCGSLLLTKHKVIACESCWEKHFVVFTGKKCKLCGYPLNLAPGIEDVCRNCIENREQTELEAIDYFAIYSGITDTVIKKIKFRNSIKLAHMVGKEISNHFKNFLKKHKVELVVPVPLSKNEMKERGFNQCEEILKGAGIPYFPIVEKVINTKKQSLLKEEERRKNIKGAFKVKQEFKSKSVCIFDDVITTGATINELARTLKINGVEKTIGYSVSRSVLGKHTQDT